MPPVVTQVDGLSQGHPRLRPGPAQQRHVPQVRRQVPHHQKLNEQATKLPSQLGDAAGALQTITVGVFGALVQLVTVLTMTFFLLLDGERIAGFLLTPARARARRSATGASPSDIYRSVAGYVAGNLHDQR